jgi:cysteine desulfurase / selenocysteine lyase
MVIDGVSDFVSHDYANIHRGLYDLSEKSEKAYHDSKAAIANLLNCKASEIFYTYNSTYAINIIA